MPTRPGTATTRDGPSSSAATLTRQVATFTQCGRIDLVEYPEHGVAIATSVPLPSGERDATPQFIQGWHAMAVPAPRRLTQPRIARQMGTRPLAGIMSPLHQI
jgi:hypothetical protein